MTINFLLYTLIVFMSFIEVNNAQIYEWRAYNNKDAGFDIVIPEGRMVEGRDTIISEESIVYRSAYYSYFPTIDGDVKIWVLRLQYPAQIGREDYEVFWNETIGGTVGEGEEMRYKSEIFKYGYPGYRWMIALEEERRRDCVSVLAGDELYLIQIDGPKEYTGKSIWRERIIESFVLKSK